MFDKEVADSLNETVQSFKEKFAGGKFTIRRDNDAYHIKGSIGGRIFDTYFEVTRDIFDFQFPFLSCHYTLMNDYGRVDEYDIEDFFGEIERVNSAAVLELAVTEEGIIHYAYLVKLGNQKYRLGWDRVFSSWSEILDDSHLAVIFFNMFRLLEKADPELLEINN